MPIEEYAAWTRDDGLPVDPWIRVHVRAGGRVVRALAGLDDDHGHGRRVARVDGTRARRPRAPTCPTGAAAPVDIDVVADRGVYHDPNVWVVHDLAVTSWPAWRRGPRPAISSPVSPRSVALAVMFQRNPSGTAPVGSRTTV